MLLIVVMASAVKAEPVIADTGDRTGIKDGDMIVCSYDGIMDKDQADYICEKVKRKFVSEIGVTVGVIVVTGGLKLSVIPKA